jgi:arylsulfatase A-like enzyme
MPATNLLMFSIDDMRTLSNWGHFTSLVSTPNLDRLAAMGTTFERAITQVPLCNPSRTSVFTGLQPSETGVLENTTPWFDLVDPSTTLPAVLRTAGAYVAMYGKHFHYDAISAADQAVMFDEFQARFTQGFADRVIRDEFWRDRPFPSGRYGGPESDLQDTITAAAAIDFLANTAGTLEQPFFLGVGISKPHLNWWVPPAFYDRYDATAIRAALELSLADGTIIPGDGEYFDVPPMSGPSGGHAVIGADLDQWVDYIQAYLAAVSFADAKIGDVLDALEADPALAADTAIVLWSDHGYHLGDKDQWGKFTLWREATQVPFIVVDPDQPGGRTAEQIVSLVDIFPTVLDLMGLETPPELSLSGNSLLPIVQDVELDWYDPGAGKGVALTSVFGAVSIRALVPGAGDLRYTRYPDGTEELYDLTLDPDEHVNRLDLATGEGLTPRDVELRSLMSDLMDGQMAQAGYLLSNGSDPVIGTAADELLISATYGESVLSGGLGGDTYLLYGDATVVEAADGGFDLVVINNGSLAASFVLPVNIEMVKVPGSFTGNAAANLIVGGALSGVLNGAGGDDTVKGGGANDTLNGVGGRDSLLGGAGNDRLIGGGANDLLAGGPGNDIFQYNSASDSSPAASDTILDFTAPGAAFGDRVDLSGLDANVLVDGNQAFEFGGTGTGWVRFVTAGSNSVLLASTDDDDEAELRIVIRDGVVVASAYTADDVIL